MPGLDTRVLLERAEAASREADRWARQTIRASALSIIFSIVAIIIAVWVLRGGT